MWEALAGGAGGIVLGGMLVGVWNLARNKPRTYSLLYAVAVSILGGILLLAAAVVSGWSVGVRRGAALVLDDPAASIDTLAAAPMPWVWACALGFIIFSAIGTGLSFLPRSLADDRRDDGSQKDSGAR